ncbi:MAG: glycosyltransferase family 4 protein [Dehalococcoidia bacterium]|nr:glycosyltransferase family 4 protein [Dehalococcoidia bacterium]
MRRPPPAGLAAPPRVLFLHCTYAGWATRRENIERHVGGDGRIRTSHHEVTGWQPSGGIERLPLLPKAIKGRARALVEARHFAGLPRPDAVWTSANELALPYLWAFSGPMRRPLILETDWTFAQQEAFAPVYFERAPRRGLRRRVSAWQEMRVFSRVTLFTPISSWAADGLRRLGVEEERIHVLHPGVDLAAWRAPARPVRPPGDKLRLLFVGGDFRRKGGDLLVAALRGGLCEEVTVDVVTRSDVESTPGLTVHRAAPNSPALRALYARADLFVLPTRAECLGFAFIEAMASGLPVIAGDVGGVRDVVLPGKTGWLIRPEPGDLVAAIRAAVAQRDTLPALGRCARAVAEERFDGRRNDRLLVDLLLDQVQRWRSGKALSEATA